MVRHRSLDAVESRALAMLNEMNEWRVNVLRRRFHEILMRNLTCGNTAGDLMQGDRMRTTFPCRLCLDAHDFVPPRCALEN